MIAQLKDSYPVERICAVLDCPCSSYYYVPCGRNDTELVEVVEQMLLRKPFFGYRRIAAQYTSFQVHLWGKATPNRLYEPG
jgi:hypothetical protein